MILAIKLSYHTSLVTFHQREQQGFALRDGQQFCMHPQSPRAKSTSMQIDVFLFEKYSTKFLVRWNMWSFRVNHFRNSSW